MKIDTVQHREEELFSEWEKEKSIRPFVRDGIINYEEWTESKLKLIYLLKSTNDPSKNILDLRSWLRKTLILEDYRKKMGATWNNIARWTYGIRHLHREIIWEDISKRKEKLTSELQSVCAINIMKEPGQRFAKQEDLQTATRRYGPWTKRQIELYNGDYIILCGTGVYYGQLYGLISENWKRTKRGIWYFRNEVGHTAVWYYHPGAFYPSNFLLYNLLDAVRELEN